MESKEKGKKQILLRISPKLWEDLAQWAEDDFRSINGQIEYLLTECVKKRKKRKQRAIEEGRAAPAVLPSLFQFPPMASNSSTRSPRNTRSARLS